MAGISYKDGATWRDMTAIGYNDGGVWRDLTEVHYKDGSNWRQVFGGGGGAGVPSLTDPDAAASSGGAAAHWKLKADGTLTILQDGVTTTRTIEWLTVTPDAVTAALYEVRRTQSSGVTGVTFTGTMTSGVWYPLNADRGVTVSGALNENTSLWEIRLIGGDGTILASSNVVVTSDL